jgi:hypothetical protein
VAPLLCSFVLLASLSSATKRERREREREYIRVAHGQDERERGRKTKKIRTEQRETQNNQPSFLL